jgi:hypothetical protein
MFKKIHKEIEEIRGKAKGIYERVDILNQVFRDYYDIIGTNIHSINVRMPDIKSMEKTIESQQRTLEQLTNALKDKYEHGLFIFSEDCKIPMVIRNGKELTNEMTSYFGIDWTRGESPNISIEQFAGTCHDSEV